MPKKSKDDWKKEGDELKKLFAAARKKDHNCAVYICAEGLAIEADPRLSADNLGKKAKKRDGATPNGVTGILKVNGTNIELTCHTDPPGSLEGKFKQYLSKIGLKLKPVLIPPAGEEKPVEEKAPIEKPAAKEEEPESDIGAILAKARKKPQNVAWLIGDKGLVLKAHANLSVDKLRQQAKSEGGGQRGALGVMTISGKTITLTCEEEPPKSFPRLAKTWMADQGHAYKVKVALPDGAELSDEDESDDEVAPAAEKKAEPEFSKEQLTEGLKHVSEIFKNSFEGLDKGHADELKAVLKNIAAAVKNGDLVGAQNMMNKLALLTGVSPNSPPQMRYMGPSKGDEADGAPESEDTKAKKKELTKKFADLKPEISRSLEIAGSKHEGEMRKLVKDFGDQMQSNDMEASAKTLEAFKTKVAEIGRERSDTVAARKTRIEEIRTRVAALKARLDELAAAREAA